MEKEELIKLAEALASAEYKIAFFERKISEYETYEEVDLRIF